MYYIGIIGRNNDDKVTFNNEVIDVIHKYHCIPIGIIANFNNNPNIEFNKIKKIIDLCDGFILQGGDNYYDVDILIAKYLYKNNIPTLGICLGMQTMAVAFNGNMNKINNHNSKNKYVHQITINKNSKLYDIIKKNKIYVNSRHNSYVLNTNLNISASDEIIEAVEDKNKNFFIGVQWHPESLMDENSILLFNNFFYSLNIKKI
ncbi:MAG TPA: gamma-glutamyl-gamma-aminobutyrate hydrolase family protein [Candidatus Faecisoma merdavium]|nr:gamma-glutamyl-gamma-aminobutyrate hydrolase family protein [Candidatus Faecisoma merdavium]